MNTPWGCNTLVLWTQELTILFTGVENILLIFLLITQNILVKIKYGNLPLESAFFPKHQDLTQTCMLIPMVKSKIENDRIIIRTYSKAIRYIFVSRSVKINLYR